MNSSDGKTPRRKRSPDMYVFAALLLVSFSLLLVSTRSFIFDFSQIGLAFFSGVRGSVSAVGSFAGRTVLSIRELAELRKEYHELLERITRYEQLERDAADIRRENLRLREQLGFSQTILYKHIPARISGRDPDNLFSALVINKGSRDGIVRNMAVIAFQGGVQALVGKIVQVSLHESLVMPVYDVNASVASRLSESRYEGIVSGQGSPDRPLRALYVKKRAKDEISFGDTMITSGMGGIFPPEIVLGRVTKVLSPEYATSIELEIECAIDFSRLEYVFALKPEWQLEE